MFLYAVYEFKVPGCPIGLLYMLRTCDSDSPRGGRVVGQERGAVALPSEAVSGLVVAGGRGLGFALLWHGPVPLTASLLQPAPPQTPFLQVDPAQLVVYGRVVEKVQRQQHQDEEAVDPHADEGCVITAWETHISEV